ncbi:NAD(P)H-quinone oxidoreductase chain 5 [Geitlerinema sp. FC II]|nr:NAD(P)H-quinone oxidoreductase chain 5 [Geitlerinema sp. FC II]
MKNRMECGDHWLVYATVNSGNVFDADMKTAVHHRKSGTNY